MKIEEREHNRVNGKQIIYLKFLHLSGIVSSEILNRITQKPIFHAFVEPVKMVPKMKLVFWKGPKNEVGPLGYLHFFCQSVTADSAVNVVNICNQNLMPKILKLVER